jgi:hypothetical protein
MLRPLSLGFRRRRAVSTMIGGLIILTLILTGVTGMVFVSQQYDQYQQTVNKMGRYQSQDVSERLVINSPGLTIVTSNKTIPGWGAGCTTTYNCYSISISNVGGVAVQITRIYINSTGPAGSGCSSPNPQPTTHNPQPCVLNPTSTIAPYAFNQANQFINAGEVNHGVLLALPLNLAGYPTVTLPNPTPAVPQNSIVIATSRGNVFSFQWPIQLQIFGQSQSAFSSGVMKVAYLKITSSGYDSKNEPGPVAGGSGGTGGTAYCHKEALQNYPAASNYAEKLTFPSGVLVTGTTLYFLNPWVTNTILGSTINVGQSAETQMYIYTYVINTGNKSYVPTAGSIDLTWYSADHLNGILLGVYYKGTYYPAASAPSITPTTSYYAIYKMDVMKLQTSIPSGTSVMFWGDASITNWTGTGTTHDQNYFSATLLVSGLWIRSGCTP